MAAIVLCFFSYINERLEFRLRSIVAKRKGGLGLKHADEGRECIYNVPTHGSHLQRLKHQSPMLSSCLPPPHHYFGGDDHISIVQFRTRHVCWRAHALDHLNKL